MKFEIKVPAVGESITEAVIGSWQKQSGELVKRNEVLLVLETDKASVEVVAENDGVLNIQVPAGKTVPIGSVVAYLDSSAAAIASSPALSGSSASPASTSGLASPSGSGTAPSAPMLHADLQSHLSPAVQKIVSEKNLNPSQISGTGRGGRLTKEDVLNASGGLGASAGTGVSSTSAASASAPSAAPSPAKSLVFPQPHSSSRQGETRRVPMTSIRKKIAERLVHSQQSTATLTTFNELDMTRLLEIRARHKEKFKEKYGLSLGFMGFFVKASIEALKSFPAVNAFIEGQDLIYNNFYNVGVAVGTEKGLIVPVIKDADQMSIAQIENSIRNFATKARDGKISVDDLSGGTFTISNGGVYGSLLSTPILNPPQSGILGMHKIEERAVVVNGKIEIRSRMFAALSYDHRIIDGKEAVSFLVKIKEGIEDPERLLLEV